MLWSSATATAEPPAEPEPARRRGPDHEARIVAAVLLLAPLIGVLLLRAPLVNQLGYVDAWFYSGYGWAPHHHLDVFEPTYYGVRFPAILLIAAFSKGFGAVGGYLVLRYLILAGAGLALYAGLRRFASPRVAAAAVVLLALNPFYLRLVLWDYVTFISIPAAIAAVALWPRGAPARGVRAAAGCGVLLGVAVFANPLTVTVVPALVAVELLASARLRPELRLLAARLAAAAAGALAVFVAGWLLYGAIAGLGSPYDLLRPTIDFLRNNDQRSAGYVLPVRKWIFDEPWIYAPVVLLLGMVLVSGRRLLGTGVAARLGQFALVFVAELVLYRALLTSSVIETWWAYGMTAASAAFAGALVLDELDRRAGRRVWLVAAAVGAAGCAALAIRLWGSGAVHAYDHLRGHWWRELVVVLAGLGALIAWRRLSAAAAAAAVVVLLVAVTGWGLTPVHYLAAGGTGQFAADGSAELRAYAAGRRIVRSVAAQDTPASRTLVWYPSAQGPLSAMWSVLPHVGGSVNPYDERTSLAALTPYSAARLAYPATARVLVVSPDPADLGRARTTLARKGYDVRAQPAGTWADGRLHHQLLQLRDLPAGGARRAIRMSADALLGAWARRNATLACQLSVPELVASITAQKGTCAKGVRPQLRETAPPGRRAGAISVDRDTARVTVAGTRKTIVMKRVQAEWLVADGDVPWVR